MIHRTIEHFFYFTIIAVAFYFLSVEIDQWEREIRGFYEIGRN